MTRKRDDHEETVRINITLKGEPAKWLKIWKRRGLVNSNREAVSQAFRAYYDLIRKSDLEERLDNEWSEIESLAEEKKSKWKLHNIYEVLEKNEIDPNEVLQSMPSFIPFAVINRRRRTRIIYATVNQGENVGVILTDESTNKGYGGLEWGINVIAFRDGESESEYYKYRATSGRRDLRNCFVEADIQNVTDEGFEVELKSAKPEFGARRIITKHYDLKKQEEQLILEDRLNPEEQKQFTDSLERIKEKLIDSHHRKGGEMPAYASFLNFGQSRRNNPVVIPQGLDQVRIPYVLPEIVDEFVAEGQGEAVLVVKAQIDFNPGGGRQFEWVAYKVTQDGKEMIDRNCAYQESLAEGQVVDIKASLLYKKHFDLNRD